MSSFEQPNKRNRLIVTIAAIAAISAAAAGCTVQPLYSGGSASDTSALIQANPTMREKLASITLDPAKNVFDLQVRNRLIFLLSGGAGEPAKPAYRVGLGLNHSVLSSVTVDIGNRNDTTHARSRRPLTVRDRNSQVCVLKKTHKNARPRNWQNRFIWLSLRICRSSNSF